MNVAAANGGYDLRPDRDHLQRSICATRRSGEVTSTDLLSVVPKRVVVDICVVFSWFVASFVPPSLPDGPVNDLFVRAGICMGMFHFSLEFA